MSSEASAACVGSPPLRLGSRVYVSTSLVLALVGGLSGGARGALQHVDQVGAQLPVLDAYEGAHDAKALLGRRALVPDVVGEGRGGGRRVPALLGRKPDHVGAWEGVLAVHFLRLETVPPTGRE